MVELQPSKLNVASSNLVSRSTLIISSFAERTESPGKYAHVAQSVERFLGKEEVTGSIPVVGSIYFLFQHPPFLKIWNGYPCYV